MTRAPLNLADLVEHWTLVGLEQDLVAAKRGDARSSGIVRRSANTWGFGECSINDAEKLTDWLAGDYAQKERCCRSAGPG